MVASSLSLVLLGSAYFCLVAGQQSGEMVEKRFELLQNARVALQFLVQDLREACPLDAQFALIGLDRDKDGIEADNIDFATHHWTPTRPGESDLCEVSWFVDRDPGTGDLALFRRRDPTPDEKPLEGGYREIMATGIRTFKLEYHDGLGWEDEWGTALEQENAPVTPPTSDGEAGEETAEARYRTELPRAVRITVAVVTPRAEGPPDAAARPDPDPPLVLRTVVRLPLATRPRTTAPTGGPAANTPAATSGETATSGENSSPTGPGETPPPGEGR